MIKNLQGGFEMINAIKKAAAHFKNLSGEIQIVTHHDTDGITSGAILVKALQREDRKFKTSILKHLDKSSVDGLIKQNSQIIFLLDFGSAYIESFRNTSAQVFILDHHEIKNPDVPSNVFLINPMLFESEDSIDNIGASAITYLFAKELNQANIDLASLAIVGMIGDFRKAKNSIIGNGIMRDAKDLTIKRSLLLLFPATRPLHKALEFSSNIFIPGVTGSSEGALNLLEEAGIKLQEGGGYRTLLDLTPEETSKLLNLISLNRGNENMVGDIYLVKFFNHLEDARELSALINGCGKMGHGYVALEMCLGSKKAKSTAESIYSAYKHSLITGLKWIASNKKIEGENYLIVDAGNQIKDTLIATLMSIISFSFVYPSGKVLIGMADTEGGRLKVSSRICGNEDVGINLNYFLEPIARAVGGEGGGHKRAAGCLIPKDRAEEFLSILQKELSLIHPYASH